jgi:hypothetical protein
MGMGSQGMHLPDAKGEKDGKERQATRGDARAQHTQSASRGMLRRGGGGRHSGAAVGNGYQGSAGFGCSGVRVDGPRGVWFRV